MLDLNLDQIKQHFVFSEAVARIKDAYVKASRNEVQTANVVHLTFPEHNGDCHVKSGHINGTDSYVIKIATGFYDNPQLGLSSSNGMMLAFSAKTGAPIAILRDEGWLTDLRTAIGGALATHALAQPDARDVLIIGTGIQARLQAKCMAELDVHRSFDFTIWGRDRDKAQVLANDLSDSDLPAIAAKSLEEAVMAARIIITTTPSTEPLIKDEWVLPGTHITAVGADCPGKQELPEALIHRADLRVCDMAHQSLAHGEFQHAAAANPDLQVIELGEVLSMAHPDRAHKADSITIADLTGIAAQDIAVTQAVVAAANRQKDPS